MVTALAPDGAATAPLTEPPAARAAVVPAASTLCPIRLVPLSSCADCMLLDSAPIELFMELMPLTSLREAISLTNWLGSAGCVGSWFFSCAVISCRKLAWLICGMAAEPDEPFVVDTAAAAAAVCAA